MHPRGRERTRKHFRNKVPRHFCRLDLDMKNSRQSLF